MRGFAFAALCVAAALAGGGAQAQTTIRFAHTLATSDTHHVAALRMAELVKERTGGKLLMTVHPAGELGNDNAILEGVRLGSVDIAMTGIPFFTAFVPKFNVMDLPYLFRDAAHVHKVVDGPIGEELLKELEKSRIKGLAFWEIGFRNVTNSTRPIRTPDDIKGLKIRTTPNPAHVEAFKLLGANVVPMPFTELYMALQTGAVDGEENPVNLIYANRLYEVQKHLSLTRHAYTASIAAMNLAKFNGLPADQQKALVGAAREASTYQRELNAKLEGENIGKIKAAGTQVVDAPDLEAFRKAVAQPVAKTYTDKFGKELLERIEQTK
jgi:TRAP-type transport system periplasmic protein